jgi:malate dehydrogenase (oxaloacetate-decarboxylating)(NADP+)
MKSNLSPDLRSGALVYHRLPRPGKIEIQATKPLGNQRDLALAYSPGVAAACEAIVDDPSQAAELTSRQNLVAVITNGTAVLGLGDIGPLASKPVMEGKAVLFKKFAGIDCFDIEVEQNEHREVRRGRRGAGADLRRHQPRGHQGPGMLRDRGAAQGPDEHPGLP